MDLIHFHKNRDLFQFVDAVKHRGLVLNQISDCFGAVQAGPAVFLADFRKLGLILFQNLFNLLKGLCGVTVCLPVCVGNLNITDHNRQKGNQEQCDQIHIPTDDFSKWFHPHLLYIPVYV